MQGHIKAHNHYFCSQTCVEKYEKQHKIKTQKNPPAKGKSPAFTIGLIIVIITAITIILTTSMITFMGIFFILLGWLKLGDLKGFSNAFSMYDIIAKRSKIYAYLYPFIEIAIGLAFVHSFSITITASITLALMAIGTIGVSKNIFFSKNKIHCACLGTLIPIPLTNVTLFEDIIMGLMALAILLGFSI